MNFNRANNVVGWIVGLIACTVFVMTMEPTGSFWDCGEFISSCYKLQIPHPPGAPLFILLGRFFIILFGDNPLTAARGVNFMSAIASGLSILFLFWTITHFARKIVQNGNKPAGANAGPGHEMPEPSKAQMFTILSAGVVGALAYTFCDSFWYSAVEGEVYASSAFFTALVFWAILKWEHNADKPGSDKWIVFIFYMMGLSIGVHLLNLLPIPLGHDRSLLHRLCYYRCRSEIRYTIYHQGRWRLRHLLREFNGHALLLRLCHLLYITDHRADLRDPLGDKESLVLSEDRFVVRSLYAAGLFHLFHHPDPQYGQPGCGHV